MSPQSAVTITFAGRAADLAGQDGILLACTAIEKVAAVGAEDEGADGSHCGVSCLDGAVQVEVETGVIVKQKQKQR